MSTDDQSPSNLGVLTSASILPTRPWVYKIPNTYIEITVIYTQVVVLPKADMLVCLLNAAIDVIHHLATGSGHIHEQELDWDSIPVRLSLNPGPEMNWFRLGATIEGLSRFLELYDPVSILFETRDQVLDETVGSGSVFRTYPGEQ